MVAKKSGFLQARSASSREVFVLTPAEDEQAGRKSERIKQCQKRIAFFLPQCFYGFICSGRDSLDRADECRLELIHGGHFSVTPSKRKPLGC